MPSCLHALVPARLLPAAQLGYVPRMRPRFAFPPLWTLCSNINSRRLRATHQPSLFLPCAPQEEARAHNDTVVLRGRDEYLNLPNKTLRFLRYALAHPAGATGWAGAGASLQDAPQRWLRSWMWCLGTEAVGPPGLPDVATLHRGVGLHSRGCCT